MFFLKILEKLGRKRVVLDRGPSHPEYHLAKPWTDRYYLLFRKRPKWFPFNILVAATGRQTLKKKENGVENFI